MAASDCDLRLVLFPFSRLIVESHRGAGGYRSGFFRSPTAPSLNPDEKLLGLVTLAEQMTLKQCSLRCGRGRQCKPLEPLAQMSYA